jgi:hypothetical protein
MGRADFAKFYVEQDALFRRIIDRLGLNAGKGSTP